GAPPSVGTTRPESSAIAGRSLRSAAWRAFASAFSTNVVAVSSGASIPSSRSPISVIPSGAKRSISSSGLPRLWLATTTRLIVGPGRASPEIRRDAYAHPSRSHRRRNGGYLRRRTRGGRDRKSPAARFFRERRVTLHVRADPSPCPSLSPAPARLLSAPTDSR